MKERIESLKKMAEIHRPSYVIGAIKGIINLANVHDNDQYKARLFEEIKEVIYDYDKSNDRQISRDEYT